MKIIFFGTPAFAAEILTSMVHQGFVPAAIVTNPDRPRGRSVEPQPPPVKALAQKIIPGVPIFQPEKASDPSFAPILEAFDADLFVIVAYGEIIKKHLLEMPKKGCINVHGSLLPQYRGAAPVQRALMDGLQETGITIMYLVQKMDAGDIIAQKKIPVDDQINSGELLEKMSLEGAHLLGEVLHRFEKEKVLAVPQEETLVTMAPKITTEECRVDWNLPAKALHNKVRGVSPHPGAWCEVELRGQRKRLKILKTAVTAEKGTPGKILRWNQDGIVIGCGDGALQLVTIQLEGKKETSGGEFVKGHNGGELRFL